MKTSELKAFLSSAKIESGRVKIVAEIGPMVTVTVSATNFEISKVFVDGDGPQEVGHATVALDALRHAIDYTNGEVVQFSFKQSDLMIRGKGVITIKGTIVESEPVGDRTFTRIGTASGLSEAIAVALPVAKIARTDLAKVGVSSRGVAATNGAMAINALGAKVPNDLKLTLGVPEATAIAKLFPGDVDVFVSTLLLRPGVGWCALGDGDRTVFAFRDETTSVLAWPFEPPFPDIYEMFEKKETQTRLTVTTGSAKELADAVGLVYSFSLCGDANGLAVCGEDEEFDFYSKVEADGGGEIAGFFSTDLFKVGMRAVTRRGDTVVVSKDPDMSAHLLLESDAAKVIIMPMKRAGVE